MESCRICLTPQPSVVLNYIFDDDDSETLLKILTCLPLRLSKEDGLPNKICNTCFHKVNDFYCFRNKAVDAENRLNNSHNLKGVVESSKINLFNDSDKLTFKYKPLIQDTSLKSYSSACTQTEDISCLLSLVDIKEEVIEKTVCEVDVYDDCLSFKDEPSTDSRRDDGVNNLNQNQFSKKKKSIRSSSLPSDSRKRPKKIHKTKLKLSNAKSSKVKLNFIDPDDIKIGFDSNIVQGNDEVIKNVWVCCICFEKYNDRDEILKHYKTHSLNIKNDITYNSDYKSLDDTKKKGFFKCRICKQTYDCELSFEKHIHAHKNVKPYKCSLCEKEFKTPMQILKHAENAHSNKTTILFNDSKEGLSSDVPEPASKRFICDLCDEKFVYMRYLLAHRKVVHPEAHDSRLVNRCIYCKSEFAHLNSLRRHLRTHTGEKNYLCCVCGKALSSREHLNFHIRIHTGFKPNICKICGKGFVKKCNLVLHERVHTGEKPHVCSHCGKAFSQRSTLVIHERYHSGARPYVCNLCNKGFVAKGLLSMHLKTSCVF